MSKNNPMPDFMREAMEAKAKANGTTVKEDVDKFSQKVAEELSGQIEDFKKGIKK